MPKELLQEAMDHYHVKTLADLAIAINISLQEKPTWDVAAHQTTTLPKSGAK